MGRLRWGAWLSAASILLFLSGCKQDVLLSRTAGLQTASDQLNTLATSMAGDVVQSCQRMSKYYAAAHIITFQSLQGPVKPDDRCTPELGQSRALQKHLQVFSLYATQLIRAASGAPSDIKLGEVTTVLSNAGAIGPGGKSDAENITTVGNAILAFIGKQNRARLIRDTVVSTNPDLQEAAKFFEGIMVSQWCDLMHQPEDFKYRSYCTIFAVEMKDIQSQYCLVGQTLFGLEHPCNADIPSVFEPEILPPTPDPSRSPSPPDECAPDYLRVHLRDGIHLPRLSTPTPAPYIRPDDSTPSTTLSAAEVHARAAIVSEYTTGMQAIYSGVKSGPEYATDVCRFAKLHQDLYDFALHYPAESTALLNRL